MAQFASVMLVSFFIFEIWKTIQRYQIPIIEQGPISNLVQSVYIRTYARTHARPHARTPARTVVDKCGYLFRFVQKCVNLGSSQRSCVPGRNLSIINKGNLGKYTFFAYPYRLGLKPSLWPCRCEWPLCRAGCFEFPPESPTRGHFSRPGLACAGFHVSESNLHFCADLFPPDDLSNTIFLVIWAIPAETAGNGKDNV